MKIARTRVPKQCEFDEMVGANLKYMRKFRQLAMTKVAEQLPFTFQQLQKYENGRNTISAYKLLKLCKIYKADIGEIVKESFIENHQGMVDKYLNHAEEFYSHELISYIHVLLVIEYRESLNC